MYINRIMAPKRQRSVPKRTETAMENGSRPLQKAQERFGEAFCIKFGTIRFPAVACAATRRRDPFCKAYMSWGLQSRGLCISAWCC